MQTPVAVSKREAVQSAVEELVAALAPSVIHIRFNFGEDWMGNPAVFFRVLLTDEASEDRDNMHTLANRVRDMLDQRLDLDMGFSFVRFRSLSEQRALNDPTWA